ncbi:hypothetical protein SAMN05892883_4294 [Jatrophihabitans sp. GAS493]|uniref:hypothetical protein n=1 Tax=Jatrophihabitans sp. GAS493 TaxID=1907575 RepID=UPI000BBFA07A|nr:hypothetical protein [Jatrophihabitans sp. GAS493]SOD75089.1 hypothetical protein SAMN05892883_4294 [Jatrophihabitans sp. GAS493]
MTSRSSRALFKGGSARSAPTRRRLLALTAALTLVPMLAGCKPVTTTSKSYRSPVSNVASVTPANTADSTLAVAITTPVPTVAAPITSAEPAATPIPTAAPTPQPKPKPTVKPVAKSKPAPTAHPTPKATAKPTVKPAPKATPKPAPKPTTTPVAGCHPLSNAGHCYKAGQFCRATDHGKSGTDANGRAIICRDNNGWRWEPK